MANQSVKESFASQGFIPMNDFQEKDIFIAGYPKSGNTWLQNIITGLLIDSTSQLLTPKLINEIIPDIHVKKYFNVETNSLVSDNLSRYLRSFTCQDTSHAFF